MITILAFGVLLICCVGIVLLAHFFRDARFRSGPGLSDLWTWKGAINAGPYIFWILIDVIVFLNLARYLVFLQYGMFWSAFPGTGTRGTALPLDDWIFVAIIGALTLLCLGVAAILTLRRLRTVGLPDWLVVLTLVPGVNIAFFFVLAILASHPIGPQIEGSFLQNLLNRTIPDTEAGSAIVGILFTSVLELALVLFGTTALGAYGWMLFVILPFFLGFISVLVDGYRGPKSYVRCLTVSALSVFLLAMALLAFAIEGVICLLLAMAIGLPLSILGGSLGYFIQRRPIARADTPQMLAVLVFALPAMMGFESALSTDFRLNEVRTAVLIQATPEQIWRHIIELPELPEPEDWLLRSGIAYPIKTETRGQGSGAIRHCVFSTGTLIEPIVVWDPNQRLKFKIIEQPPLMREISPYDIHPPHLDMQFLRCREGQFLLTPLPDGRTRLEGTSWYESRLWPGPYWRFWSDWVAHRIHLRVLNQIKMLAERKATL